MPQIRNTKVENIYHSIKLSKNFSLDDFKIEFPDDGNVLVKILLRASNKYSFSIEENNINILSSFGSIMSNQEPEKVYQTIEKPGHNKNIEIHNHENLDSCINKIASWLYNLDEDLKNEFTFDDISDIEEFEEKLNKEFPDENEKFTQDEKEKLVAKISELQERIEKLEQDNNTQKQIELLERSRKELEKYPKKAWWLKFYNRFNSLNKGLGLLNDIGDNAMKLLEKFGA
jgi:ribosomal protein S15P/S13E